MENEKGRERSRHLELVALVWEAKSLLDVRVQYECLCQSAKRKLRRVMIHGSFVGYEQGTTELVGHE